MDIGTKGRVFLLKLYVFKRKKPWYTSKKYGHRSCRARVKEGKSKDDDQ